MLETLGKAVIHLMLPVYFILVPVTKASWSQFCVLCVTINDLPKDLYFTSRQFIWRNVGCSTQSAFTLWMWLQRHQLICFFKNATDYLMNIFNVTSQMILLKKTIELSLWHDILNHYCTIAIGTALLFISCLMFFCLLHASWPVLWFRSLALSISD